MNDNEFFERIYPTPKHATRLPEPEPKVIYATVRETDPDEEWLDIECRFSDGQKYTAVQVASEMPELAHLIARFLSPTATAATAMAREGDPVDKMRFVNFIPCPDCQWGNGELKKLCEPHWKLATFFARNSVSTEPFYGKSIADIVSDSKMEQDDRG